jgi:predicted nucleic acid-binding protein
VARRHDLIVATRNPKDFAEMNAVLLDPWTERF